MKLILRLNRNQLYTGIAVCKGKDIFTETISNQFRQVDFYFVCGIP